MCGILGIVNINSGKDNKSVINRIIKIQNHRGPDSNNFFEGKNFIFGHNRLSIIDLNPASNQPFIDNSGNYILVFNGEIYNYLELKSQLQSFYEFKTSSDTEVLLAAYIKWGESCLHKLIGMFSFAIFNIKKNKFFAARDRFGVKPFYYSFKNNIFYFASEIKTLWSAGIKKEFNLKTLSNYFVYSTYGLPEETFYNNINQLPGGYAIEYDLNTQNFKTFKWYNFEEKIYEREEKFNSLDSQLEKIFTEEYTALLSETIDYRFRADVPVGFNISGGLDSSTLLALVSNKYPGNSDINAFTFYSDNPDYDELPWVNDLISRTNFPLNKCLLNYNEIPNLIKTVAEFQDEPFGGFPTLAMSNIFKVARTKGVLVLLDGQGMDEAWAGYDYYHNNNNSLIQGVKTSAVKPEILTKDFISHSEKEMYPEPFKDKLKNLQYRDLFFTKIPRALRFNDRISMMHSTELREPFLDHRLVELAFSLPYELKYKNNTTKWLLREITKKYLGDKIALAPKRPLQTPQREWISNELKKFFDEEIEKFSQNKFFIKSEVNKIWKSYLNGNNDNSFYIWQWVNFNYL
ncbi:MAG TPA: asparagine synthase (glutamine-hydrolyzing) [Bacteroidetes bacterium]|nr:asparagine synthase (glutamine-hydrolyzing) [Ignavibacteria bacterium]HCA42553.1 asparagine synthase (glutamine-hydrolyzing) [Bacteroidota bacterium]